VGLNFIQNRDNPSAFEPIPNGKAAANAPITDTGDSIYTVEVEGQAYTVTVRDGGELSGITAITTATTEASNNPVTPASGGKAVTAPLAGSVINILVTVGQQVAAGETLLVLEAMKMETNISAPQAGQITEISVSQGDAVSVGDTLISIA